MFVLDGVLIGAGDGVALAIAQVAVLAAYVPVLLLVRAHVSGGAEHLLTVLWWSFGVFMALRLIALGWRARSDAWLVTGAVR